METIKEIGELSLREIGIVGIARQMFKEDVLKLIDEFMKDKGHLHLIKDYPDEWKELKARING